MNEIPQWQQIEEMTSYLNEKSIQIRDSMYEEFMYLQSFLQTEMSDEWKCKNVQDRWIFFFQMTEERERKTNLLKVC